MNCHATRNLLDLHAEGRLNPGRAKSVEAHLASCEHCRALAVPAPVLVTKAAPADFKAKLRAAAKAAPAAEEPKPKIGGTLSLFPADVYSVALAAALVTLIALGLGASGKPNQALSGGDELAGRTP